ncbi:aldo/keto reductase [Streptomyces rubiginosohelvolus]
MTKESAYLAFPFALTRPTEHYPSQQAFHTTFRYAVGVRRSGESDAEALALRTAYEVDHPLIGVPAHGAPDAARPGARDAVRIATKVRQNPLVPHSWPESAEGLSARAIHAGVEESLERLGVDHVDLLWAHAEDRTVPLEETVGAFGELVAKGVARRVGAANHAAWRVERARSLARERRVEPWTALQLRHSLLQPRPLTPVAEAGHRMLTADDLDLARSEGLAVWSYTSLMWGSYVRADKPLPPTYDHPGTTRVRAVLDDVADELRATRNQVVLAWLMRQGIDPIVGASRAEQIEEALRRSTLAAGPKRSHKGAP